jgi:hypothetical protein
MSWSPAGKKGGDQPMTGFFFAVIRCVSFDELIAYHGTIMEVFSISAVGWPKTKLMRTKSRQSCLRQDSLSLNNHTAAHRPF